MSHKKLLLLLITTFTLSGCNPVTQDSSSLNESNTSNSIVEDSSSIVTEDSSSSIEQDSSNSIIEDSSSDSSSDDSSSDTSSEDSSSDTSSDDSSSDSSSDVPSLDSQWTNTDFANYYDNLDLVNAGDLLTQLQSLNTTKRKSTVGYQGLRQKLALTDYDPENPNKILSFYSGKSMSSTWDGGVTWNREHIWPNSRGGGSVEDDIHVIRPTLVSDNSNRGNSFYVEGKATGSAGWDPKTAGLNEIYRGQAARIVFYCVVANKNLKLVDAEDGGANTMGKLSDLLKWNLQYSVHQTELNRNKAAQQIQGNRNPFIDNPSFACAIWGNTNEKTKQICSGSYVPEDKPEDTPSDDPTLTDSKWSLVTNLNQLQANDKVVLANSNAGVVAGEINKTYLTALSATFSNNASYITSLPSEAIVFELGYTNNTYTFKYNGSLLGTSATKSVGFGSGQTNWTITIDSSGNATISSSSYGKLEYNPSAPRFTTYTSNQQKINIYKFVE